MRLQGKTWLLLCVTLLILFCMSGCGAQISTVLKVDDNFSGERVITCVVSKSDVRGNFEGGIEHVDAIINQNCPENLTFVKTEGDSSVVYTFTLTFTTFEEYKTKVEGILGRPSEMVFRQSHSVFSSGAALEEDFNSQDLLGWFKAIVRENNLMSNISNMWELGKTSVTYVDEDISTGGTIRFDRIVNNPISEIQIETTITNDLVERTIFFDMPLHARDTKRTQVDTYMDALVPACGTGEWMQSGQGYQYKITLSPSSMNELFTSTSHIFGDGYSHINTIDDDDPFVTSQNIRESFDVYSFGGTAEDKLNIRCVYTFEEKENRYINSAGSSKGWGEGNQYFFEDHTDQVHIALCVRDASIAENLSLDATLNKDGFLDAVINICFPVGQSEQAEKAVKYYDQMWEDVTAETLSEDGEICHISLLSGRCPVSNRLAAILKTGDVSWNVFADESLLKNTSNIMIDIDLENLSQRAGISDGTGNFTLKLSKHKLRELVLNGAPMEIQKGENVFKAENLKDIHLNATATKINLGGILLIAFILTLVLVALAVGFVYLVKYLSQRDGRQDEALRDLSKDYFMRGCGNVKTKFIAFVATLNHGARLMVQFMKNALTNYYPDNANKQLIDYFYGSRWPALIFLGGVIVLPFAWLALGAFVWLLFINPLWQVYEIINLISALSDAVRLIQLLCIPVSLLWYLVDKIKADSVAEAMYDQAFVHNLKNFTDTRGLQQLGLASEQVVLADPLKLVGPDYFMEEKKLEVLATLWRMIRRIFVYESRLVVKQGSDGKSRYSCSAQNIWYFSENQMYRYEVNYDLCTGEIRAESTCETFYQNLSSVSTREKIVKTRSLFKLTSQVYQSFMVITNSGNSMNAGIDSGCVRSDEIADGIKAMQNLARDRKATCVEKKNKRRSKV